MDPSDIPIAAAAVAAAGPTPSGRDIAAMTSALDASIEYSRNVLGELMVEAGVELDRVLRQRDADVDLTIGELFGRANKSRERVRKGLASLSNGLNERIDDHIRAARRELSSMDAALPLLYDEIASYNALGEHERLALESIILPAIQQQEREMRAGLDAAEPVPPVAQVVEQIAGTPPPPPPPPLPPPNGTVPPSASSSSPPIVLPWGSDIDTIPGAPAPPVPMPPPITSSPPTSPPPDPLLPPDGGSECCPPSTTNVVIDGSFIDAIKGMIGGVPPSGSTPPPTTPPPTTPPTTTPPPPPQPTPPGGGIQGMGPHDGPGLCTSVQVDVSVLQTGRATEIDKLTKQYTSAAIDTWDKLPLIGPVISAVAKLVMGTTWATNDIATSLLAPAGIPNPGVAAEAIAMGSITGFIERWVGTPLSYWTQPMEQSSRYANPMLILGQPAADSTYLSGGLTIEQWECITRMNGNLPWQHYQAMYAQRSRLSPGEVMQAWRRGLYTTERMMELMRGLGYLDQRDVTTMIDMTDYVPSTQELFTWMKKDVWDDAFAAQYGLDEDFPNPMPPYFQQAFTANGTTAQQIIYDYRSQWRLPSTTQLGEMVARLRPGRVPAGMQITEADAAKLLKLDEWPARLRGQILATLTLPVNRTDLIEAYKAGTVSEADLTERLMDLRYSRDDAVFLTRLIVAKSEGQMQGSMGAWTRRRIISAYVEGTIDRQTADGLLSRTVLDPAARVDALGDADTLREAQARSRCIKGIRRRYMTGELATVDARRALLALGVEMLQAATLMTGWQCDRESRSKEPTVKMLTEWTEKGIITPEAMHGRLRNLGFTDDDAIRIVRNADQNYMAKKAKAADAAARRAAADARRAAADAKRAKNGKK